MVFSLRRYLFRIAPIFLLLMLISAVINVIQIRIIGYQVDLIAKFLDQLQYLSAAVDDHDSENMKLFSRYRHDLTNLIFTRFRIFTDILQESTMVFAILVQLFLIHYIIVLFALPLFLILLFSLIFERKLERKKHEISEARREFVSRFEESISSFQTLIFNHRESLLISRSRESSQRYISVERAYNLRRDLISLLQSSLQGLLSYLVILLVLALSLRSWGLGQISIGSVIIVFNLFLSLKDRAKSVLYDLLELRSTRAIEKLLVLERKLDLETNRTATTPGLIEAKGLYLERGGRELFSDLSLSFKADNGYLITGESGSGKTTLLRMIMGLIKNYRGSLSLDGIDYKRIPEIYFRENIAWMPALNQTFKGSLLENVTLWDDKVDLERFWDSLRLANLDSEFGDTDPSLLNSCEDLSEGQRQRLSLARALYLNRRILILDEPFANLDRESANIIISRLLNKKNLEGRLIIISSHTDIEILSIHLKRIDIGRVSKKSS